MGMGLRRNEFLVLQALQKEGRAFTQRDIASVTGLSTGTVCSVMSSLRNEHLVEDGIITGEGKEALEPYRINNAIILAAGFSSRFAPISYEKPKGLLKVRGEILIERQIEQLIEAGIPEVIIVVGYKKEYFFYLERKYPGVVRVAVNDEYAQRNNHSSLMAVADSVGNSLICSSDNYYTENPFPTHAWKSFYSAEYQEGKTEEWCLKIGAHDRIMGVSVGGCDSWYMVGHAYFDRDFALRFLEIARAEYDRPMTANKLWEDLYVDHIDELDMVVRRYAQGVIYEFDSLDELREFDPSFLENIDSEVFDNIAKTLGCHRGEVFDIYPLKQGLTNLSCHFRANGGEYVYRHPGVGTQFLVDRAAETMALGVAKRLGLDETFIFEDPDKGWKISRYISDARALNPHDDRELKQAMEMASMLHSEHVAMDRAFDFFEEGMRYDDLLRKRGVIDIPDYEEMRQKVIAIKECVAQDVSRRCLTHNDFFYGNLLLDENDNLTLIDWEYAGMSDYASDFGTFVVCCELTEAEAMAALRYYFGREPSFSEMRHNFAYVVLAGWCWYVWSLLKEAEGDHVGNWLYVYYEGARCYMDRVLEWYSEEPTRGASI